MSIQETFKKLKSGAKRALLDDEIFTSLLIMLVGVCAFGLGRVSGVPSPDALQAEALPRAVPEEIVPREAKEALAPSSTTVYVASKSGTKYHLPWCGSAKSIKEENKIYFNSKEEAEAAGYSPAANCKGI